MSNWPSEAKFIELLKGVIEDVIKPYTRDLVKEEFDTRLAKLFKFIAPDAR